MEFAVYKGLKTSAQPGLKGFCPHCNAEVLAKCGSKKIWHWSHIAIENCDPWFEPETQWHRDWKKIFGDKYSEIRIQKNDVYHIADVRNEEGIIFEFQNSPISQQTIQERESFYGERMIWLINGNGFKNSFHINDDEFLKHWKFTVIDEFESSRNYVNLARGLLIEDWKVKSELVKDFLALQGFTFIQEEKVYFLPLTKGLSREQGLNKLYAELKDFYKQHKTPEDFQKGEFEWEHARSSWEQSQRPVFIDFGEPFLYRVTKNMGRRYGEGIKVKKQVFLKKYARTFSASPLLK